MRTLGMLAVLAALGCESGRDFGATGDELGQPDSAGALPVDAARPIAADSGVDAGSAGSGGESGDDAAIDADSGAPPTVCVPGQSVACIGPGGCAGGQACNGDGTGFEPCECAPPSEDATSPLVGPDGGRWKCETRYETVPNGYAASAGAVCGCSACADLDCESAPCEETFCCLAQTNACLCYGEMSLQYDLGVFTCSEAVANSGGWFTEVDRCP